MKNKHSSKQNEYLFKVHTACIYFQAIFTRKSLHITNSHPNIFLKMAGYNPVRIDKFSQRNISFTKQSAVSTAYKALFGKTKHETKSHFTSTEYYLMHSHTISFFPNLHVFPRFQNLFKNQFERVYSPQGVLDQQAKETMFAQREKREKQV